MAPLPGNTPTFLGSTSLWAKPECDLPRPRRREGGGGDRGRAFPLASPQPRSAAPAWTGGARLTGSVPDPRLLFGGSPPPAPTRVKPSAPRPRSREGQRGAEAGNGPHRAGGCRHGAGTRSPARAAPQRRHRAGPGRSDCPDTARRGAREGGGTRGGTRAAARASAPPTVRLTGF